MISVKNWKKKLYIKYNKQPRFSAIITLKNLDKRFSFYHAKKKLSFNVKKDHLYNKIGMFFFTRKYVKYNK